MRAVLLDRSADPVLSDIPTPTLGPGQVRVAVRASSVNHADLLVRAGQYAGSATPSEVVLGLDAAGEVVEVAPDASGLRVGDRVMCLASGGLAEQITVDATLAIPIPTSWSYVEGAAAIVGLLTEHDAMATSAGLLPGESVVITGGTSGVGLQGVQMARRLGASQIVAIARSDRGDDLLAKLGADTILHSAGDALADRLLSLSGGRGFDVAIDHVGGPVVTELVVAAAVAGRIVNVGRVAGTTASIDLEALSLKRLRLSGVTFRTRSATQRAEVTSGVRALDLESAAEVLRPPVDRVLDWTQIGQAHDLLRTGQVLGKLVLEISPTKSRPSGSTQGATHS